jgi:hypothetical protein
MKFSKKYLNFMFNICVLRGFSRRLVEIIILIALTVASNILLTRKKRDEFLMKKQILKPIWAVVSITLVMLLCSSCSGDLLDFWNVVKEMNSLELVAEEGQLDISLSDDELMNLWQENGIKTELLENFAVHYTAQNDNQKVQTKIAADLNFGTQKLPLTIYISQNHVYLNANDVLTIMQALATGQIVSDTKTLLGSAEWIDLLDLAELTNLGEAYYTKTLNIENTKNILNEVQRLIDALGGSYNSFSTKVLSTSGLTYVLNLNNYSTAKLVDDFMEYTAQHGNEIQAPALQFVESSTLLNKNGKQYWRDFINEMVDADKAVRQQKADEITASLTTDCPYDFDVQYALTKTGSKSYVEEATLNLNYNKKTTGEITIQFSNKIKATNSVNTALPADNITKLQTLISDGRQNVQPASVSAIIYPKQNYMLCSKYYTISLLDKSSTASVICKNINNRIYLPLRFVGETCGENVSWDSTRKKAVIERGNQKTYVTGYLDTELGRTYVMIRDFEKMGYLVDYEIDPINGAKITLIK